MFKIRRTVMQDVPTLTKLAKMVHFINLPADREIITQKVLQSRGSFLRAAEIQHGGSSDTAERNARSAKAGAGLGEVLAGADLFMFSLIDAESDAVLGTSQVVSRMGGPGAPNVSFQLSRRQMFSESLQSGMTHVVAELFLDETGPSELGGLILQPSYRGHKLKLGRFLSLVRFHMVGLFPDLFAERMLAEMMAPITPDGHNLVWDNLGRRFINLSYAEADAFCQRSKEFMISLLPREPIYLSLLPAAARDGVGQVGKDTIPARKMLEKLGFEYKDFIDPFDGGPHLEAKTREISLVRDTGRATLDGAIAISKCDRRGIVSKIDPDGDFTAVDTEYAIEGRAIKLPRAAIDALGAEKGARLGHTPLQTKATRGASNGKKTSQPQKRKRTGAKS